MRLNKKTKKQTLHKHILTYSQVFKNQLNESVRSVLASIYVKYKENITKSTETISNYRCTLIGYSCLCCLNHETVLFCLSNFVIFSYLPEPRQNTDYLPNNPQINRKIIYLKAIFPFLVLRRTSLSFLQLVGLAFVACPHDFRLAHPNRIFFI